MNDVATSRGGGEMADKEARSFYSELGPLLLLTSIFFLNFISRIIIAPLMPTIEKDLGMSHSGAGSLFLLISAGYFMTLLCSGFFSSRLLHRKTILLSSTAVGAALLGIAISNSLWGVRIGLLVLGMAAGIYLPSGIATLTSLISSRHWGKAIAVHELAPNLSFVAAPLVCEALLVWFSWRGVLALLGAASLLVGIGFARFGRGGEFAGEAPSFGSFRVLFVRPAFWIMVVLFSLGISGTLGIYTMLPLYLVTERGIDRDWANTLIALSRLSGLGMAFVAGWVNDQLGAAKTIGAVFLLTGISTILLGASPDSLIILMIFVQPVMAACFFPPGFAALSSIGPPSTRNVAVSLTIPVAFVLGGGAIPTGIGIMGDAGSFALGIGLVGGLILAGAILSRYLRFAGDAR